MTLLPGLQFTKASGLSVSWGSSEFAHQGMPNTRPALPHGQSTSAHKDLPQHRAACISVVPDLLSMDMRIFRSSGTHIHTGISTFVSTELFRVKCTSGADGWGRIAAGQCKVTVLADWPNCPVRQGQAVLRLRIRRGPSPRSTKPRMPACGARRQRLSVSHRGLSSQTLRITGGTFPENAPFLFLAHFSPKLFLDFLLIC